MKVVGPRQLQARSWQEINYNSIVIDDSFINIFSRDASIEELRVIRNRLCDILGIPHPVLKVTSFDQLLLFYPYLKMRIVLFAFEKSS